MNKILKEILSTSVYLLVVLLITYLIVNFVGQRTEVVGSSMESTLSDGDNLIVDKITYRFKEPERYDIIVFPFQYAKNTYYIKRIIGLPNETVQIINGKVYINEQLLNDPYGYEDITNYGSASAPITIGEGQYFVLGDNRNKSVDSRDPAIGLINEDDIIGRAVFVLYPIRSFGSINNDANATIRNENES